MANGSTRVKEQSTTGSCCESAPYMQRMYYVVELLRRQMTNSQQGVQYLFEAFRIWDVPIFRYHVHTQKSASLGAETIR